MTVFMDWKDEMMFVILGLIIGGMVALYALLFIHEYAVKPTFRFYYRVKRKLRR